MTTSTITDSKRVARLNRRLKREGLAIRCCRASSRWHTELGDLYAVDLDSSMIVAKHVDLDEWEAEIADDDS